MSLYKITLIILFSTSVNAQQPGQQADQAASAAPVAAGTVTANPTLSENLPKAFSISLFSLGGFSDKQFRNADPSMEFFDNYVSFNYKINNDFRISARPAFGYSTAGKNENGAEVTDKIRTRDFSLVAKFSNLLEDTLSAKAELANAFRLYFPTSDSSRDTGMIARLRYELEGRYNFQKSSNFRYYAKPSYYFQRFTFIPDNSNPKKPNAVRTTSKLDLEHGGEFSFEMNSYFAAKPGFEIQEKWSNSSDANKKPEVHSTTIRTGFGVEVRPSRSVSFTVSINDTRDLIVTNKSPETGYTLMTNIAMY